MVNLTILCHYLSWDWNENWLFPALWYTVPFHLTLAQKLSIGGDLNCVLVLLGHTALSVHFWLCNILSRCSDFTQAESECHSFLTNINYVLMVLDIESVFQSSFSFWLSDVSRLEKKVYSSYLYNDKTLTKFKIKTLSQVAFPIPFQM